MRRLALIPLLLPLPALAGLDEVATDHALPRYEALAQSTETLAATAATDCRGEATLAAYTAAFDDWMGVSHIQFGPIEDLNLSLAIAYWPDPKNRTGKALRGLIADADPVVNEAEDYRDVSIAAQGFYALERLLYDDSLPQGDYTCALTAAVARGLADTSAMLATAWVDYAGTLTQPGPDNPVYPTGADATRKVYTALLSGLEFTRDQRLGRPLGTFDRPRPNRAEAQLSGRSQRNVVLSLAALEDLALALADAPIPQSQAAFDRARARAASLDDPVLAGVADPMARFRIEALQQDLRDIQTELATELGAALGVSAGFNSMDGD
ncbi:imelysin family protein [Marinibacterium profundimaris]|uniref:Imelysin-like domain-containing protein n=1 Tax=Marinibacterium profundimaris TaxID=1679460 RepID=A0A225NRJ2_9RHOB|nr:imelysin family protein [Marinibacterium profundimaris]OWU77551.1 hypothetical protein ATO3_02335 [Marinibacterium profundimaris]